MRGVSCVRSARARQHSGQARREERSLRPLGIHDVHGRRSTTACARCPGRRATGIRVSGGVGRRVWAETGADDARANIARLHPERRSGVYFSRGGGGYGHGKHANVGGPLLRQVVKRVLRKDGNDLASLRLARLHAVDDGKGGAPEERADQQDLGQHRFVPVHAARLRDCRTQGFEHRISDRQARVLVQGLSHCVRTSFDSSLRDQPKVYATVRLTPRRVAPGDGDDI